MNKFYRVEAKPRKNSIKAQLEFYAQAATGAEAINKTLEHIEKAEYCQPKATVVDQKEIPLGKVVLRDEGATSPDYPTQSRPSLDSASNINQQPVAKDTIEQKFAERLNAVNEQVLALEPGQRLRLENLSDEIYHKSVGYGSSALKEAYKSPAHFRAYLDKDKTISPQLQAVFDFGTAVHGIMLEPMLYDSRVVSAPDVDKRTKEYKEFKEKNQSKIILSKEDYEHVLNIRSVLTRKYSRLDLLTAGQSEVSYWYKHKSGLILKARVDHELLDKQIIVDLKTTKSAQPADFIRTVRNDYAMQHAQYRLVTGIDTMVYIGIEKVPPYGFCTVEFSQYDKMINTEVYEAVVRRTARALESSIYDCYPDVIYESYYTDWERSRLQEVIDNG